MNCLSKGEKMQLDKDNKNWMGKLPESWNTRKIKYVLWQRNEDNLPIKSKKILSLTAKQGVIPYEEKVGGGNKPKQNFSAYKLAYPGDIVMNSMNILSGAVGLSKYKGCVSPVYYMLRPISKADDVRFFYYVFANKAFQHSLLGIGNGILIKKSDKGTYNTIRMRIPIEKLKNLVIPYPSAEEQRSIADFLDKKCADIDKLSTQIQKEIDTLQKYRKSVITKTVTKGLDDTVPMKESGIEWIGKIPETWKLEKIKFLTSKIQKGLSPQYQDKGKTNIITQATFSKGYWDESSLKKAITSHRDEKLNLVKKHDILLATTGGGVLGKTYFIKKDINYVASADVVFIRGNDKRIINKLIYYCLFINYNLLNGIMAQGSTNQLHLNVNNLKNFKLPVGSIDVQQRIVNYLDNKTSQIDKIISQKQKQLSLLSDYKNSLIFEYVTGKKQISSNGGEK